MNRKTILALVVMQVTLAVGTPPLFACGCTEVWGVGSAITAPTITSPTTADNGRGINAEVEFRCEESHDFDSHTLTDCSVEYPEDTLTYTWTCSGTGWSWKNGINTGRVVTWIAPSTPGNFTVTVTVSDTGAHGGDNDTTHPSASRVMEVIRLDKVRLYFYCDGTAFPRANTQSFNTRAVVWATVTQQRAYCGLSMNPALWAWWNPGSDEFRGDQTPPHWWENPEPHFDQAGTIYTWPSNWPTIGGSGLDIQWTQMYHHGSDPDSNSNRVYSYTETSYLSDSWGETNRTYNTPGVHRLRAVATLEGGHQWKQVKHSADFDGDGEMDNTEKMRALRISIKDPNIYQEPDPPPADTEQRQLYLEWLSVYQGVPYEWGGEGHGGKDSGQQYAGGSGAYQGYGIDCSGLVSCGAYMVDADQDGHDYDWGWWRKITCDRVAAGRLDEVSTYLGGNWMSVIQPGDIINKAHHHVMTYLWQEGDPQERIFHTIEAYGKEKEDGFEPDDDNQARQRPRTEEYLTTACACNSHTHWNPNTEQYEPCSVNPAPQYYRGRSLDPE